MLRSARCKRTPRVLRQTPVNAFQQISQLRRRDRHRAIRAVAGNRRWPDKTAAFQPLRVKAHALTVVPQNLDQAAAPAAEYEQMPVVRISLERLLHQQRQPIEPLAHVGVPSRQPNLHACRKRDHRPHPSSTSASAATRAGAISSATRSRRPLRSTTSITAAPALRATRAPPPSNPTTTGEKPPPPATLPAARPPTNVPPRACRR